MRRIIALILISISCLSMAACAAKTYRLPWDQFCSKGMDIIELEAKDKKYIIDLLNAIEWQNDVSKCDCDFAFHTQKQNVGYHSECGIFNDYTRGKHSRVTEAQRIKINTILGVNDTKEKIGTITDFSRFSNMKQEADRIDVTFDNNSGIPFYFTIEDAKDIDEIMNIIFTTPLENMGSEVNDSDHTSIRIFQGEKEYAMHVGSNKEGENYYTFSTCELQDKIIELARKAGDYEDIE